MANFRSCCRSFTTLVFHYETIKIVDIKNKKVGALYRFIQLVILAYVIGYVIVYKKGYQEFDTIISAVSTKLKGTAFVDFKNFSSPLYKGIQVYDPADYVIPAQESNQFFIMTNFIVTPNQTQGRCPEDPRFKNNHCNSTADCQPALVPVQHGNGIRTGDCVPSDRNASINVCEIFAWCPTELDEIPMPGNNFSAGVPLLALAKDFTVLVKNQVSFAKFGIQRRNMISYNNSDYFKHCLYDENEHSLCPIFNIGQVVESCGLTFNDVAYQGAVMGIIINWDCDFDYSVDECLPKYSFKRLDDKDAPISPGYNFRYSQEYVEDGKRRRVLTKAYGIKFEILVSGKAGKFSVVPLFTNLGAGLALLGIATVWCDFIVMYLLKKRKVYKEYKYQKIEDDSAGEFDGTKSDEDDDDDERKPIVQGNNYQQINIDED